MEFKDLLKSDMETVFFNTAGFADIHNYNGLNIPIVVDDDELTELKLRSKDDRADGIFSCSKLIHVQATDIEDEPFIDQLVTLDGETYYVKSVSAACGVYKIILRENDS